MTINRYQFALCATSALGFGLLAFAVPAFAQEEEIIVTARRVEERLQDVPISITVFNQKQLDSHNITNAQDLAKFTPNLAVDPSFGANSSSFSIRGFTQAQRSTASVGSYFADVVAPRGGSSSLVSPEGLAAGTLFDLENVQVLKGPQGTLFGRNTTGGAVILVPTKPKREFGGYIEAGLGNFNMRELQGVINIPINDKVRFRAGFNRLTQDGYMDNSGPVGPSHLGNTDFVNGRASLVVDITPDLENYTVAWISNSDGDYQNPSIFASRCLGPLSNALGNPALDGCAEAAAVRNSHNPYLTFNTLPDPVDWLQEYEIVNKTTWHATDLLTIKNIASYSTVTQNTTTNVQGEVLDAFGFGPLRGGHSTSQYNISEELQFIGRSANNKFTWQAGLYYEQSTPKDPSTAVVESGATFCSDLSNLQCTPFAAGFGRAGIVSISSTFQRFRDMAAYGQGTYAILDNLKLTAGIRFTHDEVKGGNSSWAPAATFLFTGQTWSGLDTPFSTFFGSKIDPGKTVLRKTSDAPTWLLDLEYNPTPDMLTYVKYARGYRQGGVIPASMNLIPDAFAQYQPESVESYEIGMKDTFKGRVPGYANVAVFYNDYSNQQLLNSTVCGPGAPIGCSPALLLENAQRSTMWGVELETSVRPTSNFRLDASAAYLATKVNSANVVVPFSYLIQVPYQDVGGPLPFAPKYKATVTGTYTLPLPDTMGKVDFSATYTFNSGYVTTACGPIAQPPSLGGGTVIQAACKTDRTNLVDLNLNWSNIFGGPVDASFFVSNLLDESYATFFQSVWNSQGFEDRQLGPPRMFGGRIKLRFGADAHA